MKKFIAAGIVALALGLGAFFVYAGQRDFQRNLPPVFHRDVRVSGDTSWRGLEQAIDALYIDGEHTDLLENLVIEVHPPGEKLNNLELNGTTRRLNQIFGRDYNVIVVRQLPGPRDACASAIHHEFAEHILPLEWDGDPNFKHSRPELTALSLAMTRACQRLLAH